MTWGGYQPKPQAGGAEGVSERYPDGLREAPPEECEGVERAPKRSGWTWAWLAWLGAFLAIELPAWLAERKAAKRGVYLVGTLSRHVWKRWFYTWQRKAVLMAFGAALFPWHFGAESGLPALVVTGVLVVTCVVTGEVGARRRDTTWRERWTDVGDKAPDLGRVLGAPWYVRLGLKLGRGGIVGKLTKLFEGKPGALRTTLALYVLLVVALPLMGRPEIAQAIQALGVYTGFAAQAAGVPVDPQALGAAFRDFLAATIALVAILRPLVRWVLAGFALPKP